jgi:heat shock protein HslJ
MKKLTFFSIFILMTLMLYAGKGKKNAENFPLLNTKWVLTDIYETMVLHDTDTAYIIFDDAYKFSGNLGCNLFFGEFSYGKKRMKLDYFGATKKLCADMEVETLFVKAIRNDILQYYIDKNRLYLLVKNKKTAVFEGATTSFSKGESLFAPTTENNP